MADGMEDRMPYFFSFEAVPSGIRALSNDTECEVDSSKDLAYEVTIQILVALTVSGISSVVDYDEFKASFRKPPIYAGAAFQFFLMPFIGFISVYIFPLKPLEAISLIILCASPGGSFSNWWCNLFNADLALSVSMTSLSTVAAIGMLPFNILIYVTLAYENTRGEDAGEVDIDFATLGTTLGVVITSIILGLTFGIKYPHLQPYSNLVGNVAGLASIILGVFATTDTCDGEGPPWQQPFFPLWVGTAFPLLVGLVGTFILSGFLGLIKQQRVAIALETAYQNTGIALAYALSQGAEGRAAAGVPVIYGGYEAGFFGLFMLFSWKVGWTYAPPDYNIFKVMIENFQPGSENYAKYFESKDPEKSMKSVEPATSEEIAVKPEI
mmetsp:Transcript_9089/g.10451  ORF Transcript_9089/g.10451 Transcript_9089/m.10451 type:complete len:382 (-) Transcript_9089:1462-2607(-)